MRQDWTDDRIDDLSDRMEKRFDKVVVEMKDGFERVNDEIGELRGEIRSTAKELRGEMQASAKDLRGEIKAQGQELRREIAGAEARLRTQSSEEFGMAWREFGKVRDELAKVHSDNHQLNINLLALHQTMTRIGWSGMVALIATLAGLLITRL